MVITITAPGSTTEKRFRAFQRLIKGVTYRFKRHNDGETAVISFDDKFTDSTEYISRGNISVEVLLHFMSAEELKIILEECLINSRGTDYPEIYTIRDMVDSFPWGSVNRPEGRSWGDLYDDLYEEGL